MACDLLHNRDGALAGERDGHRVGADARSQEETALLRTPLCEVLGIDVPIILAPMGSATSAEFAAAVSNQAGSVGSVPCSAPPEPSNATSTPCWN